ncbi:MAG: hypothetical protein R2695_09605 [Acidimicrobiales bacterium]
MLRSLSVAVVWSIAVLLVLGQLDIDLAPLIAVPASGASPSASAPSRSSRTSCPACSC